MTAHMVEQIIKFSDGTETVIKYRGVIENGVLTPDTMEENTENPVVESAPEEVAEAASEVVEETEVEPETV